MMLNTSWWSVLNCCNDLLDVQFLSHLGSRLLSNGLQRVPLQMALEAAWGNDTYRSDLVSTIGGHYLILVIHWLVSQVLEIL